MTIGARVEVLFADGTSATEHCDAFIGSAGPATRRGHHELVSRKFLDAGGSHDSLRQLEAIDTLDAAKTADALECALATRL